MYYCDLRVTDRVRLKTFRFTTLCLELHVWLAIDHLLLSDLILKLDAFSTFYVVVASL
jgi:hypothetical protein